MITEKKFRVEYAFAKNFVEVNEWQTIDGMDEVEAENAENAAVFAAYTEGLENARFRVYELSENDFGKLEPVNQNEPEYFYFGS